ncbi:hypothetical protein L9F63_006415, partial [Diploptera punctata]
VEECDDKSLLLKVYDLAGCERKGEDSLQYVTPTIFLVLIIHYTHAPTNAKWFTLWNHGMQPTIHTIMCIHQQAK